MDLRSQRSTFLGDDDDLHPAIDGILLTCRQSVRGQVVHQRGDVRGSQPIPRAISPIDMPSERERRTSVLITPGDKLRLRPERSHLLRLLAFQHDTAKAVEGILGESHDVKSATDSLTYLDL